MFQKLEKDNPFDYLFHLEKFRTNEETSPRKKYPFKYYHNKPSVRKGNPLDFLHRNTATRQHSVVGHLPEDMMQLPLYDLTRLELT